MKGKNTKISKNHKIVYAFLLMECFCYVFFLYLDIFQGEQKELVKVSLWIKWLSIIVCFSFVTLHQSVEYRKKEKSVVSMALFFTVMADFFLLLTDWNIIGILCFIIIQTIYLYRLTMWNDEIRFTRRIVGRFLCSIVILLFAILVEDARQPELIVAVIYVISLVDNIAVSASICFYHVGSKRKSGCFFAGLCLLFLCDVQVAVYNADMLISVQEIPIISKLTAFAEIAMWLFYLPSQVLITLSGRLEK